MSMRWPNGHSFISVPTLALCTPSTPAFLQTPDCSLWFLPPGHFANASSSARFGVLHSPSHYLAAPSHPADPSCDTAFSGEALVTSRSLALWALYH